MNPFKVVKTGASVMAALLIVGTIYAAAPYVVAFIRAARLIHKSGQRCQEMLPEEAPSEEEAA